MKGGLDPINSVDDRRVILATEGVANFCERGMRQLAGKVHGHLTGKGDGFGAIPRLEV